jgi:hypothetical protein
MMSLETESVFFVTIDRSRVVRERVVCADILIGQTSCDARFVPFVDIDPTIIMARHQASTKTSLSMIDGEIKRPFSSGLNKERKDTTRT